ncbi:MAG: UDP-N-acetylmuramoyl-tripeptide--D-alanyl-D-alanine ligase [Candidatus Baltobacteraceae bacterium]
MMLSIERARAATGGAVYRQSRFPAALRIATDSRGLVAGETFLALRGEHFDGHAYVPQAIQRGAAALVVDDAGVIPDDTPALVVADTKRAYMDLAAANRELFEGRVVAITGSAGKTTTKHLLAQLLAAAFGEDAVLATPGNENNEIGVSKLLLRAQPLHRFVVVELGARHVHDIAELVAIARPHVGVLTNIGEAHLEIFGSRERLAETKWGLFASGAQAVLGANDAESLARAGGLPTPPLWFGTVPAGAPGVWIPDSKTLVLTAEREPSAYAVDIRLPGEHNRMNLAAAIAGALLLGVSEQQIVGAIRGLTLPLGRFESIALSSGPRLIYDAYNANLSGMLAALDAFAAEPARRRIAVLAGMAELGPQAHEMHERVGAKAAAVHMDTVLAGGEFAGALIGGALAAGFPRTRLVRYETNEEAAHWIRLHAGPGDAVLLKGSRKYAMEQIVQRLLPAASA